MHNVYYSPIKLTLIKTPLLNQSAGNTTFSAEFLNKKAFPYKNVPICN